MRAGVGQVQQGDGDRLLPAGDGQGPDAAFQGGHPLLEDVGRGVHQPRVDPAHLLQGEQVRRVFGALEHVAGGLMDRHRAGAGGRVGLLPGVQGQRAKAKGTGGVRRHDKFLSRSNNRLLSLRILSSNVGRSKNRKEFNHENTKVRKHEKMRSKVIMNVVSYFRL